MALEIFKWGRPDIISWGYWMWATSFTCFDSSVYALVKIRKLVANIQYPHEVISRRPHENETDYDISQWYQRWLYHGEVVDLSKNVSNMNTMHNNEVWKRLMDWMFNKNCTRVAHNLYH